MAKLLKMAGNDDTITLKAEEQDPSSLTMVFEDNSKTQPNIFYNTLESNKYSEYNLNL